MVVVSSHVELLILYEDWAGERLGLERIVPLRGRAGRPISVSPVPVGPSNDISRTCRVLGAMLRALRFLPGGLGRFIPCRIGANHCRLRAIGWELCGHGLTSWPFEASAPRVLGSLLTLFGYPTGSEDALIAGRLRMRYCNVSFANKKPTWGYLGKERLLIFFFKVLMMEKLEMLW